MDRYLEYVHFVENKDKTALTRKIQERRRQEKHVIEKIEHLHSDNRLKQKLTKRLKEIHEGVLVEEEHIRTVQRIVRQSSGFGTTVTQKIGDANRFWPLCINRPQHLDLEPLGMLEERE